MKDGGNRVKVVVVEPGQGGADRAAELLRRAGLDCTVAEVDLGSAREIGEFDGIGFEPGVCETSLPVVLARSDGTVTYWNAAAERVFGWSAADVVGQKAPHVASELRDYYLESQKRVLSTGKPQYLGWIRCQTRDGRLVESGVILFPAILYPSVVGGGRGGEVVAAFVEVEKQVEPIQKAGERERLESLGRLVGGIAHELNSAITAELTVVQLLKAEAKTDPARSLLRLIESNTERAAAIVKQILRFAGVIEPTRTVIRMNAFVVDMVRLLRKTFAPAIAVRAEPVARVDTVLGDMAQLQQAVLGLCMNAAGEMGGCGTLTLKVSNVQANADIVRATPGAEQGQYVMMSILGEIGGTSGERYMEAGLGRCLSSNGTGNPKTAAGLGSVLGIVRAHDGFARFEHLCAGGVSYQVYLPVVEFIDKVSESSGTEAGGHKSQLVLVIDDEPSVLSVIGRLLEEYGYRVITAPSGTEGVELFAEHCGEIDLVVTDLVMPELDGAATIRRIRAIDPNARIVVITGDSSRLSHAEWRSLAVQGTLAKPFTTETLLTVVRSVLQASPFGWTATGRGGDIFSTFVSA